MKLFLLSISLFAFSAFSSAQNCPIITSSSITPTGVNNYTLAFSYTGSGAKHINVSLYCGLPVAANLISTTCVPTSGNGSNSINFVCADPNPTATLTASTGNCGGGTSCATIQVNTGGGPLPLKMTSFLIKRSNNKVLLNWNTESEIDVKDFEIQRHSANGYETIMTIPASNNTIGSSYSFADNNSSKSTSMYRLKVNENGGKFAYSEIRAVKGFGSTIDFNVYPNPTNSNAKVNVTDISEASDLQLIDQMGRVVKTIDMSNKSSVELNNLQKGNYIIRLVNKTTGEATTHKLTVAY